MYDNAMAGLDAWLESPYTNASRQEAAFEDWCDREDVDPNEDGAWERFEAEAEERAEAAAEAAAESRIDAMLDRDW